MKLPFPHNNSNVIAGVEQTKVRMALEHQALPFSYNNSTTLQLLSKQSAELYIMTSFCQTEESL
jgi:hypothetical protein